MKILHLIPTLELGGAERQLSLLAPAQVLQGHEVHIAVRRLGPFADQLQSSGVKVHMLGDGNILRLFAATAALAFKLRPQIMQSWLLPMDFLAFFASRLANARWIISERTSAPQYRSWPLRSRIRILIGKHADAIVANSTLGAAYWGDHGVNATVIQNAIPPIPPPTTGTARADRKLLMVGRMTEEKSHITALIAISQIRSELPELELTIVGDGPLRPSLEQFILDWDMAEQVKLLGRVDSWWHLLHESTVLMNLSTHEGQPNVVLEAAAAGCPVLLSDIPAHREVLSELEATFVMSDSADRLGDAIKALLATPNDVRQKAMRALTKVAARSAAEMSKKYDDIYKTISR